MSSELRIPTSRLTFLQDVIFGRKAWRGPDVATRIRAKHVTLWSWLNRNGLPVKLADDIAQELERRADDLTDAATKLRREALTVLQEQPVTVVEHSVTMQPLEEAASV